jgi:hypothetical protein
MTLRAWIITMRGRAHEALCPELQVLRDQNRSLRADYQQIVAQRNFCMARVEKAEAERDKARAAEDGYRGLLNMVSEVKAMEPGCPVFLATPPQGSPARRPLTDEEIDDIWNRYCDEMGEASINDAYDIARAIERAHKIGGNDE